MSDPEPGLRDDPTERRRAPRPASASRLLLLTAVWPGLGHLAAGRRRGAAILGLPPLILLLVMAGAVVLAVAAGSATSFAARLFDPAVLATLLAVQAGLLLWRLAALGAVGAIPSFRPVATTALATIVAVVIVVAPQLWAAGLTADARDAAVAVLEPVDSGGSWVPDQTAPPVEPNDPDFGVDASPMPSTSAGASDSASPSAGASATPGVPRVNVLLIGMDSGVGRNTALTDTMIVASLDPVAKTVSMASIPRDLVDVPLPDGRTFRGKINSLVSYVRWHPGKFPGAKNGQAVLTAALGGLLGIRIDLWAQVNLGGFVYLVDSVGGVNINVTNGFCDPTYDEYGMNGFGVSPGRYHMNGGQALAYARIRHAAGESDFTRAARQQEVIAALRDRLVGGAFMDNPGRFLRSLGQTISTNVKPSLLADYIDIAAKVGRKDVYRVVVKYPLVRGTSDKRGSIQVPDLKAIKALGGRMFTPTGTRPKGFDTMPSAGSGGTKRAASSSTCGVRVTPKPTRKPTPKPTARPTAKATPKPTPRAHAGAADGTARPHTGADGTARVTRPARAVPCPGRTVTRTRHHGPMSDHVVIPLPEPCLVVLVGAAGSGKSTFAARHFAAEAVLSSDAFRERIAGDPGDQTATRAAFAALHRALERRLAVGRTTVVDATNATTQARRALLVRSRAAGVPAVAIVLDLPEAVVRGRNASRGKRAVPDDVVRRHLAGVAAALHAGRLEGEGFSSAVRLADPASVEAAVVVTWR